MCFSSPATMARKSFFSFFFLFFLIHLGVPAAGSVEPASDGRGDGRNGTCAPYPPLTKPGVDPDDLPLLQFSLNLEHLGADFFLNGALGHGIDVLAPEMVMGGSTPTGAQKANLDPVTEDIIEQFGYQKIGHLKVIKQVVLWFPRPSLNLSSPNFAHFMNQAVGRELVPPFDPYANTTNFLLAAYIIPYLGLTSYVGTIPNLKGFYSKRLMSGLMGVESGQDAVIRSFLYQRKDELVHPYNVTVADFADRISTLRNQLGGCDRQDEGLVVSPELGPEGGTKGNVLAADIRSLSYARTPAEVLRVVYGTGSEHRAGGFFPEGGKGEIALGYLGAPEK